MINHGLRTEKSSVVKKSVRDDIRKKKSKKQEFGPLSVDPYPPTIKREVLIRDIFDFFLPPTLLIEIGTFLKKIDC